MPEDHGQCLRDHQTDFWPNTCIERNAGAALMMEEELVNSWRNLVVNDSASLSLAKKYNLLGSELGVYPNEERGFLIHLKRGNEEAFLQIDGASQTLASRSYAPPRQLGCLLGGLCPAPLRRRYACDQTREGLGLVMLDITIEFRKYLNCGN